MRIKYNRVSTIQQSGNRFKIDTNKYDKVFFDKISGKVPFKERPQAQELVKLIEKGVVKEIVIEDLSRLGRNTGDSISTLEWLNDHNINVIVINLGLESRPQGKENPIWRIVSSILSSIYTLEVENILERTSNGRIAYIANGGKLGRPLNSTESETTFLKKKKTTEIIKLLNKGRTIREIGTILRCSNKTIIKTKRIGAKYGLIN